MDSEFLLFALLLLVFAYDVVALCRSSKRNGLSHKRLKSSSKMLDILSLLLTSREDSLGRKEPNPPTRRAPNSIGVGGKSSWEP